MPDDSLFESGHQPVYRRERSREVSQDELDELERRARKEGKRDIILSQLVEQQADTANTIKDINARLTKGDLEIKRATEGVKSSSSSIQKIGEQVSLTAQILDKHLVEYQSRCYYDDEYKKNNEESKKPNPLISSILSQVISAIIMLIVVGALMSYFASKDQPQSNKGPSQNKSQNNP